MSNTISIVIIGYNSQNELIKCLDSLNNIQSNNSLKEIIYVDDGSNDDSVNIFKNSSLPYKKIVHKFNTNKGRVFATQKGIELASSNWILFLQSNIVVNKDIINEYTNVINMPETLAYMGKINYKTSDDRFEKYLNHSKRGLNNVSNGSIIKFDNLLFGNCLIKKNLFEEFPLNLDLDGYGGEELDFTYKVNLKYPNTIRYCEQSIVTRIHHPEFKLHLERLFEYGNKNLKKMESPLQLRILKSSFFVNPNFLINFLVKINWFLFWGLYNLKITILDYYIMRVLMGIAIIRGYYSK